jgi:TonB family protein
VSAERGSSEGRARAGGRYTPPVLPGRRQISWGLWLGCLAAALLAHAALMVPSGRALARSLGAGYEPKPAEERVMALDLLEPDSSDPEQFVEVDEADEAPPPDTKRLSNRNVDVETETKAPPGKTTPPSKVGTEAGQPTPPTPETATETGKEPPGDPSLVEAADGSQSGADSAAQMAQDWGKLGGSSGALRNSVGPLGNPDRVPDIEEGKKSLLDSKEHLYASFFSRMRGRILEHWSAQKAIDRNDPSGSRLGGLAHTTVVRIHLDSSGAIDKLSFERESGIDYLDAEAIRALKAAGPFPNPPPGLFENGEFVITVAFTVEPDGSARIFRRGR